MMWVISSPAFWRDRTAVSRPEPGPRTYTSTLRMPCSIARFAACSAACCAANGVDLREPLNPTLPDDAHEIVFPCRSVIVTIVLLKLVFMWAAPWATFLRSLRLGRRALPFCATSAVLLDAPAAGQCLRTLAFFLMPMFFLGPLRVRAFVWVR